MEVGGLVEDVKEVGGAGGMEVDNGVDVGGLVRVMGLAVGGRRSVGAEESGAFVSWLSLLSSRNFMLRPTAMQRAAMRVKA